MAKKSADDALLAECEPYFPDGVRTIAQFARHTQEVVRAAVDKHWASLVEALGLPEDDITLLDYWCPDKLQKAKPTDEICIGVKLKVSDLFEAGIYRYWEVEDEKATGIDAYTWIKGRTKLDQLSKAIDDLPDAPPEPEGSWEFFTGTNGTFFIRRVLGDADIGQLDLRLDELITYYIRLLTNIGGMQKYLK